GGKSGRDTRRMRGGGMVLVQVLVTPPADRRFLVTNPPGYSLKYDGLVLAAEKRMSNRWQTFASYTFSRVYGLQASNGTNPAGGTIGQSSTIAGDVIFGRDPNDLTNARGRLPNDRPHLFRAMGTVALPRTAF